MTTEKLKWFHLTEFPNTKESLLKFSWNGLTLNPTIFIKLLKQKNLLSVIFMTVINTKLIWKNVSYLKNYLYISKWVLSFLLIMYKYLLSYIMCRNGLNICNTCFKINQPPPSSIFHNNIYTDKKYQPLVLIQGEGAFPLGLDEWGVTL